MVYVTFNATRCIYARMSTATANIPIPSTISLGLFDDAEKILFVYGSRNKTCDKVVKEEVGVMFAGACL